MLVLVIDFNVTSVPFREKIKQKLLSVVSIRLCYSERPQEFQIFVITNHVAQDHCSEVKYLSTT